MSMKGLLRIAVSAGLLAAVLLSIQALSPSAPTSMSVDAVTEDKLAGSDWIERHPSSTLPANYYAGSDWIERHPSQPGQ